MPRKATKVKVKGDVIRFRRRKNPLPEPRAIAVLHDKGTVEAPSIKALGELIGWERTRTSHAIDRWETAGFFTVARNPDRSVILRALPVDPVKLREFGPGENREREGKKKRERKPRPKRERQPRNREGDAIAERENNRESNRESISKNGSAPNTYRDKPASKSPRRQRKNALLTAVSESLKRTPISAPPEQAKPAPKTAPEVPTFIPLVHSSTSAGSTAIASLMAAKTKTYADRKFSRDDLLAVIQEAPSTPSPNASNAPKNPPDTSPAPLIGMPIFGAAIPQSENFIVGLFSRTSPPPEPPADTPPPSQGEGKPAQVPLAHYGYGYPATARYAPTPPAPRVERPAWRFFGRSVRATERPADSKPAAVTVMPPVKPIRRSFALILVAYGFFCLSVAINVWNARTFGGDWLDMAIPMALGILSEGALFFLPPRIVVLPGARKWLAIGLYVFVMAFALINSLRMASLIAADQANFRGERQTAGVQRADGALERARAERDRACRTGQGKSQACRISQQDVAKLEQAQTAATGRVQASAKPENADFSNLMTWLTRGAVQPGVNDFAMIWLLFRTVLPQVGGLLLMAARR